MSGWESEKRMSVSQAQLMARFAERRSIEESAFACQCCASKLCSTFDCSHFSKARKSLSALHGDAKVSRGKAHPKIAHKRLTRSQARFESFSGCKTMFDVKPCLKPYHQRRQSALQAWVNLVLQYLTWWILNYDSTNRQFGIPNFNFSFLIYILDLNQLD